MTEAEIEAIGHRYFDEVWIEGQEATIDALFPGHGVAHGLGDSEIDVRGPRQFKIFASKMRGAFPDIPASIEDIVADGDKVIVRVALQGTHSGSDPGVVACGVE